MQFKRKRKRREPRKRSRKRVHLNKKKIIIVCVCLCVVLTFGASGFFLYRYFDSSDTVVPVSTVSSIMGIGSGSGNQNRYAGVIESQKSWTVKKDASRDIKKIYVKEGDEVTIGTKLFEYDESSMQDELAQAKIELQQYDIDIADLQSQVRELEAEKKSAAASDKLSYTLQIQAAQNDIKKNEYEKKQKQQEITEMQKSIGDTAVVSELDGVVTKVGSYTNSSGSDDSEMGDESGGAEGSGEALITITGIGNYRVKCRVNEQNYSDITEGEAMLVHSRVDDTAVWTGSVAAVDSDNADAGDSDMGAEEEYDMGEEGSEDEMTSSSSYTFYVNLDSSENLLLGQHVYVEMDNGQAVGREGVWLDEVYICDADGEQPYVWAADEKERLVKKYLELGEYDETMFQYEILSGLTLEDKIAYPDDTYEEGMKTEESSLSDEEAEDGAEYDDAEYDDTYEEFEDDGTGLDEAGDGEFDVNDGAGDLGSLDVGNVDGLGDFASDIDEGE